MPKTALGLYLVFVLKYDAFYAPSALAIAFEKLLYLQRYTNKLITITRNLPVHLFAQGDLCLELFCKQRLYAAVAGCKIGLFHRLYVAARQVVLPRTAVAVYK